MFKNRIIPCLLLSNKGLVKTIKFKNPRYVGDPINAVKIFNEKEVDEIAFLDINASKEQRKPAFDLIADIASECFFPFCYGGGIRTIADIRKILFLGAEKVTLNSYALENPGFIKEAAEVFGSQSIVVSIDIKRNLFEGLRVYDSCRGKPTKLDPVEYAILAEKIGAGEIFLNSVDKDGTYTGYDLEAVEKVSSAVNIPVIACGGAGSLADVTAAINIGKASAAAAGSLFVFHGKHRAVLINYPSIEQIRELIK